MTTIYIKPLQTFAINPATKPATSVVSIVYIFCGYCADLNQNRIVINNVEAGFHPIHMNTINPFYYILLIYILKPCMKVLSNVEINEK